jgi:uncharacterized membrane protein
MRRSQVGLAMFWVVAGLLHFLIPRRYEAIVPPYVPIDEETAVSLSGLAEIAGGLAVIPERTRNPFARWWLLGVLAAVYPANIWMATNPQDVKGADRIPRWLLWARLPVQPLFALWVWRATSD